MNSTYAKVVDTALLFGIAGLTRQLASLKDVVKVVVGATCQPPGQAHDRYSIPQTPPLLY